MSAMIIILRRREAMMSDGWSGVPSAQRNGGTEVLIGIGAPG